MATRTKIPESDITMAASMVLAGATYTAAGATIGLRGDLLKKRMATRRLSPPPRNRDAPDFVVPDKATDIAYLAGILDGEGSICATIVKSRKRWVVCVYNTDLGLVEWLLSFGGLSSDRMGSLNKSAIIISTRPQYGWVLNKRECIKRCLTALLPYLKIKRAKALAALADLSSGPSEGAAS